jgi:hypothetical protein
MNIKFYILIFTKMPSTGDRGMGVRYKGSQGQTKRTVEIQEEEEEENA